MYLTHAYKSGGIQKCRVCPKDPFTWLEWRELKHETNEQMAGSGRVKINAESAKKRRKGKQAVQPHGPNCLDLDVLKVDHLSAGADNRITVHSDALKTKIHLPSSDFFPLKKAWFGPYQYNVPAKDTLLLKEYGNDCFKKCVFKRLDGTGASKYCSRNFRNLHFCQPLLNCCATTLRPHSANTAQHPLQSKLFSENLRSIVYFRRAIDFLCSDNKFFA